MKTKLHFLRYEFKYILNERQRLEIESELGHFLQLDPYVEAKPGKTYIVRSLYFDDPVLTNYYEKIDGMLHRAKFRLRTYTNNPFENCPKFLEIKGRHDTRVFKHRTLLNPCSTDYFFENKVRGLDLLNKLSDSEVKEKFKFEIYRKRIAPVMLIDYIRRPYISKYDSEFRLTFDENLVATKTESLFPSNKYASRTVMRRYTVMEVKFRYSMPAWFHRIVQAYELKRVSVSKIVKGISTWKLAKFSD